MRRGVRLAALLILVAAAAGRSAGQDPSKADGLTQGQKAAAISLFGGSRTESVTMETSDGHRRTLASPSGFLFATISEKKFTLQARGKVQIEAAYTFDPKQDPPTIDLKTADGNLLGIYQLDRDRLKIALGDAAEGRPKELKANACGMLLVLHRANGCQIWMINADGTDMHPFWASAEHDCIGTPAWSPDGSKVAFGTIRMQMGQGMPRMYVVNASGEGLVDLGPGQPSSWSPDGKRLAFTGVTPDREGLCTIAPDGSNSDARSSRRQVGEVVAGQGGVRLHSRHRPLPL